MKRIVKLTERDLSRIIRRVIKEDTMGGFVNPCQAELDALSSSFGVKVPPTCMMADGQKQCIVDLLFEVQKKVTTTNVMDIMGKYYAYTTCQEKKGMGS